MFVHLIIIWKLYIYYCSVNSFISEVKLYIFISLWAYQPRSEQSRDAENVDDENIDINKNVSLAYKTPSTKLHLGQCRLRNFAKICENLWNNF